MDAAAAVDFLTEADLEGYYRTPEGFKDVVAAVAAIYGWSAPADQDRARVLAATLVAGGTAG